MSNMEVINAVKHYQRNIEKCSGDVQRMLHCLQKLYRLPVTVQHLQETGVGRTVNALRKYEGDTGEAAKALVNKWKAMVAEAESSDEDVPNEKHRARTESPPPRSSSHKHKSNRSDSHREESHSEKNKSVHRNHTSSSHSDNQKHEKLSSKSKHHDQGHKRRHEEENRRTEEKRRRNNVVEEEEEEEEDDDEEEDQVGDSGHESHEELENDESDHVSVADSDRSTRKGDEEEEEEEENEGASGTEEVIMEEVQQYKSDSSSDTEHVPQVQVKHKSQSGKHNGTKQRNTQSENISHCNHNSQSSRDRSDGYEKSERSREKSNHSDHRHSKKTEEKNDSSSKTGSKSDSVHSNKEGKLKIKEKERIREKEKIKEREKEREKDREKEREKDREKEREKEKKKSEVKNKEDSKKKVKDEKRDEKSKQHIPKQESKSSTSSSKNNSCKVENKSKSSSSKKVKTSVEETEDGIDSFSGTSFADALGMMGMVDNVSKKKKKVSSSGNSSKKPEGSSGSLASSSGSSGHKHKDVSPHKLSSHLKITTSPEDMNLLDPSVQLEPLDQLEVEVDVDATLPTINPNYRPLPHLSIDAPSRARAKTLTEEEALSQVMSTKNQRTKVYSGVKSAKSWATVPSLFDICVRVLQENIDALEYTGGVPYDLLKPVLILATPDQLFALEHYNPYLIEETDELWESHVRRKFRNERRLDMESHREMFQRCIEESEAKLKALTLNIQNAMAKCVPVRQTKLAYVDCIAKPSRQVARKQAKFGTANATATTPMAKVQKLASPGTSSANRSNSPVVHGSAPRASHSAKAKPRMAPLMQKTMKLAKSFKR